jgi:hypothetical protein
VIYVAEHGHNWLSQRHISSHDRQAFHEDNLS